MLLLVSHDGEDGRVLVCAGGVVGEEVVDEGECEELAMLVQHDTPY